MAMPAAISDQIDIASTANWMEYIANKIETVSTPTEASSRPTKTGSTRRIRSRGKTARLGTIGGAGGAAGAADDMWEVGWTGTFCLHFGQRTSMPAASSFATKRQPHL